MSTHESHTPPGALSASTALHDVDLKRMEEYIMSDPSLEWEYCMAPTRYRQSAGKYLPEGSLFGSRNKGSGGGGDRRGNGDDEARRGMGGFGGGGAGGSGGGDDGEDDDGSGEDNDREFNEAGAEWSGRSPISSPEVITTGASEEDYARFRTKRDKQRRLPDPPSESPMQQYVVKIASRYKSAAKEEALAKLDSYLMKVDAQKLHRLPGSRLGYMVYMTRADKERLSALCPRPLGVTITPASSMISHSPWTF